MKLILYIIFLAFLFKAQTSISQTINCLDTEIDFDQAASLLNEKNSNPRIQLLQQVKLPENPSDCEIDDYITTILFLSRNQRSYIPTDPQVMLLSRAAKDRVDLLIPYGKNHYGAPRYIDEALRNLASEANRKLIIDAFRSHDYLIDVIAHKQWGKYAEEVIIDKAIKSGYRVNYEYIEALVGIQNEKHNELLKRIFLASSNNRHVALPHLKNQPNFDYAGVLNELWNNQDLSELEAQYTAINALNIGNKRALQWLVLNPESRIYDSTCRIAYDCASNALLSNLDQNDLKGWYIENKNYLIFNEEYKTFEIDNSFDATIDKIKTSLLNMLN